MNARRGTTAKDRKPAKRQRLPLYLRLINARDLETGEPVKAFVALTGFDRRILKDRGYKVGDHVRAELKKPRNEIAHAKAHAMAGLVGEQVEGFAGMGAHDILKKLQADSGAACETVEYDIPGVGKLTRREPQSLSFDEMEEGTFNEVMTRIREHIREKYFVDMSQEYVDELIRMYENEHAF